MKILRELYRNGLGYSKVIVKEINNQAELIRKAEQPKGRAKERRNCKNKNTEARSYKRG